jgi:peroxiredoxin/mono/diheme cytochrome c family protein
MLLIAGFVLAITCSTLLPLRSADKATTNLGKKAADFSLKDTNGNVVSLASFKDKKAVVVVFVGTECPINNAFMPRLAELHKAYAGQGVQFLAINANRQDTAERVAEHAKRYSIPFPVLKDEGSVVADQFGAQRTPEAFVLDAQSTICYQGRIDDQFGNFYSRPQPTRRDLAIALDEVLAGKAVTQPKTDVAGCIIARATQPKTDGTVTYTKQVARILQKNCQECHRPGQIGPMALLTYDDAASWSETIREVVQEERMPPWFADPHYGKFANDRRLAKEERETLLAWIAQGCPKGDDKDLPRPVAFVEGWRIGKPDLILSMKEEFEVPAEAPKTGIPYQHFEVETNFTEDRWVERAEARPGANSVVHHIVVFINPPKEKFIPKRGGRVLVGTAPGDMPLILKPGLAKKVPAGSKLIFQMHYTVSGTATKDRSSVGLIFAKEPPTYQVLTLPVAAFDPKTGRPSLRIPAGADNHKVESQFAFSEDTKILGFMPHMHLRGKDFLYEVIYPDGKTETLLSVPRYNFNWQSAYRLAEPKAVPKGTKIHCVAHFDNSSKNPNNPDPTQAVEWGDQTWEEMMIGWTDFVYDKPAK